MQSRILRSAIRSVSVNRSAHDARQPGQHRAVRLSIEAVNVIFRACDGQRHAARHRTAVDDLRDTGLLHGRPWHWPNARLTAPISGVPTK